jgi:hypothetical protein
MGTFTFKFSTLHLKSGCALDQALGDDSGGDATRDHALGCRAPRACCIRGSFFPSLLLPILELSDTTIYEPGIRALFGTTPYFC